MKNKIKELVVLEGKHDKDKIERLFDCQIILTNGLGFTDDTLKTISAADKHQGVLVITDPDGPGIRIRDAVSKVAPNAKHVFINKKDAIGKRNVGVEYTSDEVLLAAIKQYVTKRDDKQEISWSQYLNLGLIDNKIKRDYLTEKLNIVCCNNKRLFKYLNSFQFDYQKIVEILKEYDRNN